MPQPRCSAGYSSVIITKATADPATKKVRVNIWSATNCSAVWLRPVRNVVTPVITSEPRKTRRRPMRSAKGITRKAGSAPTRITPR